MMNADERVTKRQAWREERVAMLAFSTGDPYDPFVLTSGIRSLSEVVVSIHYSGYARRNSPAWEELLSVGTEKALSLLRAPYFDPSRNVRGYLYTGVRNEVGNYVRREAKAIIACPSSDCFQTKVRRPLDDDVVLGVEYEKQHEQIRERLRMCGVMDDQYRGITRGAALYRAIL